MTIKKLTLSILCVAAILMLTGTVAFAEDTKPSSAPDPKSNPMLAEFLRTGAKVFYLGPYTGLNGWLVTKGNQVQIIYSVNDNKDSVVGVLFDAQGNEVTSRQIKALYDSNKEVFDYFSSQQNMPTAVPTQPSQLPGMTGTNPGMPISAMPVQSPGERLIQALQGAAGVDVGAAAAPKLYMIVDPNCPHCHEAWQALRNTVFGGKLQIRLVPVGVVNADSERAAAQFLRSANPLEVWDKYISGDQNQLAGTPDATVTTAIRNNRQLVESWHIQTTPYMTYRAKNGQVKIVQGEPKDANSIISDIAP